MWEMEGDASPVSIPIPWAVLILSMQSLFPLDLHISHSEFHQVVCDQGSHSSRRAAVELGIPLLFADLTQMPPLSRTL